MFTLFYISIIELREIIFAHLVHISINIFGQEYFCSYIEKHTWRKNIVLALVGHVRAMVEAAIDRGAAVKEVAEKNDYRDHDHHDYNHHIHS